MNRVFPADHERLSYVEVGLDGVKLRDMVHYRRNRIPGGIYFFTLTLANRASRTLVDHVDLLRDAMREVRTAHPFSIVAMVVLPDHLHAVWHLPEGDDRFSMRWRLIKSRFTAKLRASGVVLAERGHGERRLWARRFWEHTIRDNEDLSRHVDYLHFNPVKHGLVARVADWPYSSFHRFVDKGWLAADWGGGGGNRVLGAGE